MNQWRSISERRTLSQPPTTQPFPPLPYVDPMFVEGMAQRFPDVCPGHDWSWAAIQQHIGRVQVIRAMREVVRQQQQANPFGGI